MRLGALAFAMAVGWTSSARAATYYIAATGLDSNPGTDAMHPWAHAPGMPACAQTCASTEPAAGDRFVFRGGDTWHAAAGTPVGMPWAWTWSGSSTTCNIQTGMTNGCIYVGVDPTFYSGSSFTRPIFDLDNPLNTDRPASCAHDNSAFNAVTFGTESYLIVDDLEFRGACWAGSTFASLLTASGTQVALTNLYFHGWTYATPSIDDSYHMIGGNMPKADYILIDKLVCDGSDSSLGTTAGQASGFCLTTGKEIAHSVFRHVSNGMINNPSSVHDNLFEYVYEPQGEVHGNVMETNTGDPATGSIAIYNNVVRHTGEGVTFWPEPVAAPAYIFNNVFFDVSNGGNCVILDGQGAAGTPVDVYVYNNTFDDTAMDGSSCEIRFFAQHAGQEWNGTGHFENNHYIAYSPATLAGTYSMGGTLTVDDHGHHVFQSESTANAAGYTPSNSYAPTSGAGATVDAGASLTTSCATFSADSALCSGTSGGAVEGAGGVAGFPAIPVIARGSGAWNAGAYECNPTADGGCVLQAAVVDGGAPPDAAPGAPDASVLAEGGSSDSGAADGTAGGDGASQGDAAQGAGPGKGSGCSCRAIGGASADASRGLAAGLVGGLVVLVARGRRRRDRG